jgi:signal transduction histidine kinase
VMVVQAGAERRVLKKGARRTQEVLTTIEQAGRQALGEMGRLVEMLRKDDERSDDLAPQPGIENLDLLIEQIVKAGLPTELRVEGDPVPLPRGVEVSAYRIVQEALTNTLKHAGPARAAVTVHYQPREIELEIVDDGSSGGGEKGGGHGLIGMRERVAVYGGELRVGPRPDGGYAVRATLPLDAAGA